MHYFLCVHIILAYQENEGKISQKLRPTPPKKEKNHSKYVPHTLPHRTTPYTPSPKTPKWPHPTLPSTPHPTELHPTVLCIPHTHRTTTYTPMPHTHPTFHVPHPYRFQFQKGWKSLKKSLFMYFFFLFVFFISKQKRRKVSQICNKKLWQK